MLWATSPSDLQSLRKSHGWHPPRKFHSVWRYGDFHSWTIYIVCFELFHCPLLLLWFRIWVWLVAYTSFIAKAAPHEWCRRSSSSVTKSATCNFGPLGPSTSSHWNTLWIKVCFCIPLPWCLACLDTYNRSYSLKAEDYLRLLCSTCPGRLSGWEWER